ncbi:MAG: hypothetical protein HY319_16535 [Armatimonadetes bacterium]|nr:hypothetical protein [Armatimonadota bacterium]
MGRLMTQEEVAELLDQFQKHLGAEQRLQEELVGLKISGSRDQVAKAQKRHDELIEQIDRLRIEEMIPVVERIAQFVAACQELEAREGRAG